MRLHTSSAVPGAATLLSVCKPSDSDFLCRLRSLLSLLDAAAWTLGVLLALVVVLVWLIYRRKSRP